MKSSLETADIAVPRVRRLSFAKIAFLLICVLPTLATVAYGFLSTSPFYRSEVRIAIEDRTQNSLATPSGMLASMGIFGGAPNSLHSLRRFLESSDALDALENTYGFSGYYRPPTGDWLTALPTEANEDAVLRYYRRLVTLQISTTESILTLDVWAYDPKTAYDIATNLVMISENFLNTMNLRALNDQVAFLRAEVDAATQHLAQIRVDLTDWRNRNNALDPLTQARMIEGLITDLETELTQLRADVRQLLNTNNPERFEPKIRVMQEREASLLKQVAETHGRLTGSAAGTVSQLISEYETFVADLALAQKRVELALTSLDMARQAALQQQKYLLLVTSPSLTQERQFPRPFFHGLLVLSATLLVFGTVVLVQRILLDYRRY